MECAVARVCKQMEVIRDRRERANCETNVEHLHLAAGDDLARFVSFVPLPKFFRISPLYSLIRVFYLCELASF